MSHASPIEVVARFDNAAVHAWTGAGLVCSRGTEIFVVPDLCDPVPVVVGRVPANPVRRLARWRPIERLTRWSIQQVLATRHGYLASTRDAWFRVEDGSCTRIAPFAHTRPMNRGLCAAPGGEVYVAEYTLNRRRRPVRIFRSRDLCTFTPAWEFPAGAVRHVHALIADPEVAGRIWVLTGDRESECGIHYTDDGFATLECFYRGGQRSRATDLLVRDGHLLWGMDSPDEAAYVLRARRDAPERIEALCALPGPAYYMAQNRAGGIYVGTTAEPGRAVRDRRAHAFRLAPGGGATEIFALERDALPQHGILSFPSGVLPGNALVYGQRALKPHEGCVTIARDRFWG